MKINGSDLMVFVTVGGKLKSIAYATNHQFQMQMNTKDTSTKDDGNGLWQNFEAGLMSWSLQSDNLMSDAAENGASVNDLFDLMLTRTPVEVAFALQVNNIDYSKKLDEEFVAPAGGWTPDPANQYHGKAIITSLTVNAQNGEKANSTVTLTGCGNVQKMGAGIQSKATTLSLNAKNPQPVETIETATIKK